MRAYGRAFFSTVSVALVFGLGVAFVLGRPGSADAQTPGAPRYRLMDPEGAPPPAPPELSPADVLRIVSKVAPGSQPGDTWVRVTPQNPFVKSRGNLFFYKALRVDTFRAIAGFNDDDAHVIFNFYNGGPGRRYLADCAVVHVGGPTATDRVNEPITFRVQDASGRDTVDVNVRLADGSGHVTWVIPPSDHDHQKFSLSAQDGADWVFWSCKATTL